MSSAHPKILRLMPVLDFGGVESRIITQSGLMKNTGFDFRVLSFWKTGAAAERVRAHGIQVDELGIDPAITNPKATLRLYEYVMDQRFDAIHASILEANVHAALCRRMPAAPSVAIEEVGMPARTGPLLAAVSLAYRQADIIVGVSNKTCETLRESHRLPASKVRLVYNAINPSFFAPIAAPTPRKRLRFLAVGRLVEVKNHKTLIDAFAQVAKAVPDVELHIVGEGPLRSTLEAQVQLLGLEKHVVFAGFRNDVSAVLDDADVYVMSSISEGTSISLAEAMARGKPVVTSIADGIDEAMVGYPRGWQVPTFEVNAWADKLTAIASMSSAERTALGLQARALVEKRLSVDAWLASLRGMYTELSALTARRRSGLRGSLSSVASFAVGQVTRRIR